MERLDGRETRLLQQQGSHLSWVVPGCLLGAARHTACNGCSGGSESSTACSAARREAIRASRGSSAGSAGRVGGGLVGDRLTSGRVDQHDAGVGRCRPGFFRIVGGAQGNVGLDRSSIGANLSVLLSFCNLDCPYRERRGCRGQQRGHSWVCQQDVPLHS